MDFVWMLIPNSTFPYHQLQNQQGLYFFPQPNSPQYPEITNSHSEPLKQQESAQKSEKLVITREDLIASGNDSGMKVWTQEEDRLLLLYRDKERLEWEDVAKHIPNRSPRMCYNRHKRISLTDKVLWRRKDDEKLLQLMEEHGQDWKTISYFMPKWTLEQIKGRYLNHLRPGLNFGEWTLEEDLQLIRCFNENGRNWQEAQRCLPGRSLSQIQYRLKGKLLKLNEKKLKSRSADNQQ